MTTSLSGIRVLDFLWLGAGAWGSRYLAAYGAEVIRVEWHEKHDFLRFMRPYREYRSMGPVAAGISGLTAMSGLPGRYPAGFGYSYMDVMAPWLLAIAVMSAILYRNRTGLGQFLDLSQVGASFQFLGTTLL